jgi:hypothetical protein
MKHLVGQPQQSGAPNAERLSKFASQTEVVGRKMRRKTTAPHSESVKSASYTATMELPQIRAYASKPTRMLKSVF